MTPETKAPILLFGYGNPSRGDDALGPTFLERIAPQLNPNQVECLTDFQLQIEHALDLRDRQQVIFIDASLDAEAPFHFGPIAPSNQITFSTHAIGPQSVLATYEDFFNEPPPPCYLLAIRGYAFELFQSMSVGAEGNLRQSVAFALEHITRIRPQAYSANRAPQPGPDKIEIR